MIQFFHRYYHLIAGSKSSKGKLAKSHKQNLIEDNDSDETSALSYANDSEGDKDGSDDEDGEVNEDDDVAQMSDREARRLFNDEVLFYIFQFVLNLMQIFLAAPGYR